MGQRHASDLIGTAEPEADDEPERLAEAIVFGIAYAGTLSKFPPRSLTDDYEPPFVVAAETAARAVRDWRAFLASDD